MPKPLHRRLPEGTSGDGHNDTKIRRFEDPLDVWLKQELTSLYAGVLDEPLPPALAELLREYEKKLHTEPQAEPEEEPLDR